MIFMKDSLDTAPAKVKLNLGCGRYPRVGWLNLDVVAGAGVDIHLDLERCRPYSIPLENDSVDEFLLSHILEHIRDTLGLMQELYRIAKPGAKMEIRTPYGSSDDAWEDQTHVRPYFINSFLYFSQPAYWRADYGYLGDWQEKRITLIPSAHYQTDRLFVDRNQVEEMIAELEAVKPMRKARRQLQEAPQVIIALKGSTIDKRPN